MLLQEKIAAQLPAWRERRQHLMKDFGSYKVCDVTVEQLYAGIRGVQVQVSDISCVEAEKGILMRGYSIPEILTQLPKAPGAEYPLAGGLYYLLLVGDLPTFDEAIWVEDEWKKRSQIPPHVYQMIQSMPADTHPMTLFAQAILAMQSESVFSRHYREGQIVKDDYWIDYLEDSLNLTARLPAIAAYIYNLKYRQGKYISPHPALDWAANFSHMIGKNGAKDYQELSRLFFIIHADHEGANVSAHTAALVCSALSDVYLGCSAAMNGLAGPLHGLANQECLRWLLSVKNHFGAQPSDEELGDYLWKELNAGKIIPGYGHAVLRTTDPRFTAQLDFGKKHIPDDEIFCLADQVYRVLPPLLSRQGKVKNPLPNVDAIMGACQYHYGITQDEFYTVLFGVSRCLGLSAHAVWSRALNKPIERPKSLTTSMLEQMVQGATTLIPFKR